jgi:hypothetical protein
VTVGGTGGGVSAFGTFAGKEEDEDDDAPSREQSEHPESASAARKDRRPITQ